MFEPVKRVRLYENIMAQVRTLINEGKLKSGERLPSDRDLALQFKVSRVCAREAIHALELQGLVDSLPGVGTIITADSLRAAVNTVASSLPEGGNAVEEVFEMRSLLEPEIACLAAQRATPEEVQLIEEILLRQEREIAEGRTGVNEDEDFHLALVRCAHNSVLVGLVAAVGNVLSRSREQYLQSPRRSRRSMAAHRDILDAIKRQDAMRARQAMRRHITEVRGHVKALFTGRDVPDVLQARHDEHVSD